MPFKPVGVDENSKFPTRVETRLAVAKTDVNAYYSGSTYPLRNTVTADLTRRVRWIGPIAPTIGGGYAVTGLDIWEQT